jgi:hypothetical protein
LLHAFLTSALYGVEWSASRPAALPPGKELLDRRLGRHQSRSGRSGEEKNSQTLPGFEPLFIQTVAQYYTSELSRLLCCKTCKKLLERISYFTCYEF